MTSEAGGTPTTPLAVVVCPDKFRGACDARRAAEALAAPLRRQGATVTVLPLSDGGEGFLDVLSGLASTASSAPASSRLGPVEVRRTTVAGPTGAPTAVPWALAADGTAIVESALACGHPALGAAPFDPMRASTRGVGEVLVAARRAGARRVLLGIGGTVTTDGGLGALDAMGWDPEGLELVAAVDTRTRYLDAARVFAAQKGADADQVARLGTRLEQAASLIERRTGLDVTGVDGTGAGGGLAGAVVALGGSIRSGVDVVAAACDLERHLGAADLVVTGEGRLDATSVDGKAVGWVLDRVAPGHRAVVVGAADPEVLAGLPGDVVVRVLVDAARDADDSIARVVELLTDAARSLVAEVAPHPTVAATGTAP